MSTQPQIAIVLGTRPEIIKLSPIIRECERTDLPYTVIHTGQHYSDELDTVFFEQLELPAPDYNLDIGSASHGEQTGQMLIEIERVLLEIKPDIVLVQGDTNSVLAGAIATSKLDCELGHVEAGLRSFDRKMPEETNRVVADHVADYLFAPTETAAEYLLDEGRPKEVIHVTGNTVVDAVQQNKKIATHKSEILDELALTPENYAVMTAHRAENVDDPERFADLLDGVAGVATEYDFEVIYPIHPRAEERLDSFDVAIPDQVRLVEPLDYLDFLTLQANAGLILTDSGGIQEEACILQVPCVTLRDSTERPETLEVGANVLAGVDPEAISDAATTMLDAERDWTNPYGDGDAAARILQAFKKQPVAAD